MTPTIQPTTNPFIWRVSFSWYTSTELTLAAALYLAELIMRDVRARRGGA